MNRLTQDELAMLDQIARLKAKAETLMQSIESATRTNECEMSTAWRQYRWWIDALESAIGSKK